MRGLKNREIMGEIKDKILEEYKKGNIVVASFDGLQVTPLDEFIKQPTEGMLYDLNRCEAVVLTFLPDPKWVNDYAVSKVIQALKRRIDELEKEKTIEYPNFQNIDDDQKAKLIKDLGIETTKTVVTFFKALGLKTHIEQMIIDENSGDEYIFSFKKVN